MDSVTFSMNLYFYTIKPAYSTPRKTLLCINIHTIYKTLNYLSLCLMKCLDTKSTKYTNETRTSIAPNAKLPA